MQDIYNIDWNDAWKEQIRRHNECRGAGDCASIWEDKKNARKFWEMSRRNDHERARKVISSLPVTTSSRILDIGAGPGGLAIPLCRKAAHVTAVEPSQGMLEVLRENITEHGCDNITCLEKRWEDVGIHADLSETYDIVIASFSLGMPDIREAIEKMEAVCDGHIFLYWFAGDRPWDPFAREIWPQLHGREYHEMPKCDMLYNILYQMGIYPNMETFSLEEKERFSTIDEAVEHFGRHLGVKSPEEKAFVAKYLESRLERESGNFTHRTRSTRVKIWWEKRN
jgi:ubiquinone/menaquinone biosynthesis C-methylase UbiE